MGANFINEFKSSPVGIKIKEKLPTAKFFCFQNVSDCVFVYVSNTDDPSQVKYLLTYDSHASNSKNYMFNDNTYSEIEFLRILNLLVFA